MMIRMRGRRFNPSRNSEVGRGTRCRWSSWCYAWWFVTKRVCYSLHNACRITLGKPPYNPVKHSLKGLSSRSPQRAFPYCEHAPVIQGELGLRNLVALYVPANFSSPEPCPRRWHLEHGTRMPVPEAAMHEKNGLETWKN